MKKAFLIVLLLCLVAAVAACAPSGPVATEQVGGVTTADAGDGGQAATTAQAGVTVTTGITTPDNGAAADQGGNANGNLSVPADFPNNVPLYQGNKTLVGSIRQEVDNVTIFHLAYGVNTDTTQVGTDVGNALKAQSGASFQQVLAGTEYMFMGTIGGWDYLVVVADGSADEYTTMLTYQITEHQ